MMTPLDYGRSFLVGKSPENEARFWVESRTRITDEQTGAVEDYIQAGSCKSEHTFAEKDLFMENNYDFIPVFGPNFGIIFRRPASFSKQYKICMRDRNMWGGQKYHIVEAERSEELPTNKAVIESTHRCLPVVAQTEIWNAETGLRAVIEYPVKTLNINVEKNMYQVDTGPVALPDLSARHDRHVDGISLAFVAFNVADFADFVIEAPTPIYRHGRPDEEVCRVHHYSRLLSLEAKNRLYAVETVEKLR